MEVRFDRFEEQLEILHGLWASPDGETFSYSGLAYSLDRAPALPKPIQSPLPIIIGGSGRTRTPALAARWAREFNSGWEKPAQTKTDFDRVTNACARIGRDPGSIRLSSVQTLCGGDSHTERERWAARSGVELASLDGLVGNESDLREQLGEFENVGVDRMYVEILDVADLEQLDYFATAVGGLL